MAEERVKRKLTAIVVADVVGSSRLMGADEAGTLAVLKRHREELIDPKIADYGGTTSLLRPFAALLISRPWSGMTQQLRTSPPSHEPLQLWGT